MAKLTNAQLQARIVELEAKLQATEVAHAALTEAHKQLRASAEAPGKAEMILERVATRFEWETARVELTIVKAGVPVAKIRFLKSEKGYWRLQSFGYAAHASSDMIPFLDRAANLSERKGSNYPLKNLRIDDGSYYRRQQEKKAAGKKAASTPVTPADIQL